MKINNTWDEAEYTFIKIWSISTKENNNIHYNNLDNFIPKEWQLLLTSDGSLTRHINILKKQKVQIKLIKNKRTAQESLKSQSINQFNKRKRETWLVSDNQPLIFAQSYWLEPKYSLAFNSTQPIGQILIDNEMNIHRELTHIYCGYCKLIEAKFGNVGPLWGRSYLMYFNYTPALIIHEIFSPYLVKDIKFLYH